MFEVWGVRCEVCGVRGEVGRVTCFPHFFADAAAEGAQPKCFAIKAVNKLCLRCEL